MDPLSVTASVIAIIGLASKIISLCQEYVTTMKDAPSDLRSIMVEAGSLKSVVTSLEFFLSTWGPGKMLPIVKSLEGPEGPLGASRKALVDLEKLFPSAADHNASGTKRRATTISYAKLAWPFKEEKARKLLNDISRYKATISLALTTDTANDTKIIKANVERLCDALDLETREKVLKWLVTTDPSLNHNTACALHDSHTGTWVTRSKEYRDWKDGSARFLWFHGIPGAGKTILFSYIVEDIKQSCKTLGSKDVTCSYYYCYFGRAQDEVPHLLRWVINQLCRRSQYIPQEILDCFKTDEQPSVPVLVQALSTVLRNFQRVYLMFDALDESLDRHNLLRLLKQLVGDSFEKLKLLATSRKEIDIEISLTPISTNMSLSNPYVDEDIRIYIQNQLQVHHKLCTWPKSLYDEISAALVKGAKGMFRWAACQIDILGRLHNVSDIRAALHELPETLDATYERILMNIPQKHRKIAYKVLQLLAYDINQTDDGISFQNYDALAEAVIVDVEQLSFSPEKRLLDRNALFEICTCLITLTGNNTVILAHYSVKEYLVSERIQQGSAASFQISEIAFNVLAAKICLVYLLNITYEDSWSPKIYIRMTEEYRAKYNPKEFHNFPLLLTAIFWNHYIPNDTDIRTKQGPDTAIIDNLIIEMFDPKDVHSQKWLQHTNAHGAFFNSEDFLPFWQTQPGAEPNTAFAIACGYNLVETAKVILKSNPNLPTSGELLEVDSDHDLEYRNLNFTLKAGMLLDLLDVAIYLRAPDFVELLLCSGANPNGKLLTALKIWAFHSNRGYNDSCLYFIIHYLLAAAADPNPRGTVVTPLQAASLCGNSFTVEDLLDAGAHVNAVGEDEAIVVGIKRRSTTEEDPFISRLEVGTKIEERYLNQSEIDQFICMRSSLRNYETPLRIVEKRIVEKRFDSEEFDDSPGLDQLLKIKKLLVEHGGKSLNLYPGQDFPGHSEANNYRTSMLKGRISYIMN